MMNLAELLPVLAAQPILGEGAGEFASVSIDTRTMEARALYVALRGPRFDGHDFAATARERGATALLVDHAVPVALPQLVVADTRVALAQMAAHWRAQFRLPVIAVTGSNGKTTTTQMIAAILARAYGAPAGLPAWFATRGNRNNDIGVPLMLLELRHHHRAAVLELGMNHPGEIAQLSGWVQPSVAVVTNAQREHQEFLDSPAATARENGAAIQALAADGTAVFAADEECTPIWREFAGARPVLDFSLDGPAAVRAELTLEAHSVGLKMRTPAGPIQTRIALGGAHNGRNALAATAACLGIGVPPAAIAAGLADFAPVSGRGVVRTLGAATLIDDSYNANPDSVRAAIDLLARQRGERVLVFGDMGEVGARGPQFHREIGAYARACGIEQLLAVGEQARAAVLAFGAGAQHFASREELAAAAGALVHGAGASPRGLTLLVKGSRFMGMEKVIAALVPEFARPAATAQGAGREHA